VSSKGGLKPEGHRADKRGVTTIRTSCPRCGEVDLGPESIELCMPGAASGEGTYSFVCPVCLETVEKQADQKIAALLRSAGVSLVRHLEDSVPEGLSPLSLDEIIQFHFLLQEDSYLDRFLADR